MRYPHGREGAPVRGLPFRRRPGGIGRAGDTGDKGAPGFPGAPGDAGVPGHDGVPGEYPLSTPQCECSECPSELAAP